MKGSTPMTIALGQVQKLPHAKIITTVPGRQHQMPIQSSMCILMQQISYAVRIWGQFLAQSATLYYNWGKRIRF